jgi:hypothetical protein
MDPKGRINIDKDQNDSMDHFAVFQKAQKTLDKNPNDAQAQFIVDLWNASRNLHDKNVKLAEDLAASETQRRHLAGKVDMLESRVTRLLDKATSQVQSGGGSLQWIDNLIAPQQVRAG